MKKILIVDDEQDIVESLKFVLEVSGYVCYTAYNGEDGLRLAKELVPDLIILDVMMPKINGYKISRLLKYDNKYKDIPIIMVTARSQLEDKMIGEETGVNEYITKPFELDATNRKLQKLERLKSEFISIVSHELRTPLTAIKNAMDIILSGKAGDMTENIEKFVSMGKRNAIRLSGIINDLLDISKIEAGKMDFKFELIHVEPVIEYVKTNLSEVAKEKNLTIKYIPSGEDVEVYADSNRLEQVLTNLVSNAIKFTPDAGEIEITSKVVNARELQYDNCFEDDIKKLQGNYLQVCVEDHGIGIERKDLNHVFDKFAQIENSLSRKVGGSGLGLPIARQLMESHNGAIWCDSEINKGSKFYFVIPIANDKSNFTMIRKQLSQKARSNGSTIAVIKIKSTNEVIENLLKENNLLNKTYMTNSLIEKEGAMTTLSLILMDGDKPSAEFLKKKIDSVIEQNKNLYGECDIMYSYEIEGDTHEKDSYSR